MQWVSHSLHRITLWYYPGCLWLLTLLSLSGCSYDKQMRSFTDDVCVVPEKFEGWRKNGLQFWCKIGLFTILASHLTGACIVHYTVFLPVCSYPAFWYSTFWAFLAATRPCSISSLIVTQIRAALGRVTCELATVLCELKHSRWTLVKKWKVWKVLLFFFSFFPQWFLHCYP